MWGSTCESTKVINLGVSMLARADGSVDHPNTATGSPGPRSGTARITVWRTLGDFVAKRESGWKGHRQTGHLLRARNVSQSWLYVLPDAMSNHYRWARPRRNYESKVTQCAERRWRTIWLKDIRLSLHTQTLTNTCAIVYVPNRQIKSKYYHIMAKNWPFRSLVRDDFVVSPKWMFHFNPSPKPQIDTNRIFQPPRFNPKLQNICSKIACHMHVQKQSIHWLTSKMMYLFKFRLCWNSSLLVSAYSRFISLCSFRFWFSLTLH